MNNILVIKLRYIGDVLLATPVLSALRQECPQATITMAVNRGTEDILRWNPDLNEVMVVPRGSIGEELRFLVALRRRRFDCVIDLTDGDRSAFLSWATGAKVRIGFNDEHRLRGRLYSQVVTSEPGVRHRVERDMAALQTLGLSVQPGPLTLRVSNEDERFADRVLEEVGLGSAPATRLVMLQPGARYWFKAWPVERFAELADRLAAKWPCRFLVGGTESERPAAEMLQKLAQAPIVVLAGRLTLLQYAAVLNRCALFIGNDTGAMHMAAAVGTPVVALFGPSDPKEWGPRGERATVLYKGLDCRACFHPTCGRGELNCMKQISVDETFAAVEQVIGTDCLVQT